MLIREIGRTTKPTLRKRRLFPLAPILIEKNSEIVYNHKKLRNKTL